jgi:AraC-like DNA-binding protein/quercetin dioxygenase-like cupin family protein
MSRKRHGAKRHQIRQWGAFLDPKAKRAALITTLVYDYQPGHLVPWHFHDWDQLVYATSGVMTVRTEAGTWIVPAQRAVWIPAGTPHQIRMSGHVSMRTLYLKPGLARRLARHCEVVNVSPLMKELILHACTAPALARKRPQETHLVGTILDQLHGAKSVALQLPEVGDARSVRVAKLLVDDPSDQRSLDALCERAGASKRTIERLFRIQTGMTFGKWRQQLRLMHALRMLAEGRKITDVALESGYSTTSAFISMFKKTLGTTPSRYFRRSTQNASEMRKPIHN